MHAKPRTPAQLPVRVRCRSMRGCRDGVWCDGQPGNAFSCREHRTAELSGSSAVSRRGGCTYKVLSPVTCACPSLPQRPKLLSMPVIACRQLQFWLLQLSRVRRRLVTLPTSASARTRVATTCEPSNANCVNDGRLYEAQCCPVEAGLPGSRVWNSQTPSESRNLASQHTQLS